jgi:hypothetical protein
VCKRPKEIIKILADEMKNLVSFNKFVIFAFAEDIRSTLDQFSQSDGIFIFKTYVEGSSGVTGV